MGVWEIEEARRVIAIKSILISGRTASNAREISRTRTKVSEMPGNFPIEEDIFHPRALSNIVHDHVASSLRGLPIDNNSNMRHSSTQIPSDKVPRRVVFDAATCREILAFALKKHHEIGHSAMIDVRIRTGQEP